MFQVCNTLRPFRCYIHDSLKDYVCAGVMIKLTSREAVVEVIIADPGHRCRRNEWEFVDNQA